MSTFLAFVRSVPASFAQALTSAGAGQVIDVARAVEQHATYIERLRGSGFQVEVLPTPDQYPDGPFIEDAAVFLGGKVLLTRPALPSRQGEVAGVGAALVDRYPLRAIEPPGTLEGGDVLRVGHRLYVGRSARTNQAGIDQLDSFASAEGLRTIVVPVRGALHLKSVVTALDGETLVASPGHFDPEIFAGFRILWVSDEREVNTLTLPDGNVLVPSSRTAVEEAVGAAGYPVVTVDVSEFEKADGGLTCLSIRTNGT